MTLEEKRAKIVDLYFGEGITPSSLGDEMIYVQREGFNLIISKDNTDEVGYFFVESINGHDSYSYNSESSHTYRVLDGEGVFDVGGELTSVRSGDFITIGPWVTFYYSGTMLLEFEMKPNFKEENDHVVRRVTYPKNNNQARK